MFLKIVIRGSGTLLNQTILVKLNLKSWDGKIRKKAISTLSFNESESLQKFRSSKVVAFQFDITAVVKARVSKLSVTLLPV